jgi:hypothetical protein
LEELTSDNYKDKSNSYDSTTKNIDKMIESQYKDFFVPRNNTANNFRHNLSVYCRKEANSPLDAIKIANSLITQMSDGEKHKTKELLSLLCKDGQRINEVIVDTYHEAVKDVPLNEKYLLNNRYENMIARPMYDTLSNKGEKIDKDFNLKIGDEISNIAFNSNKLFGHGKETIYQNCKILSSSKEGNIITLIDGKKSFYDVPRDSFLKEYAKFVKQEKNIDKRQNAKSIMRLDIER